MPIIIREAVEGDYDALCEIISEVDSLHCRHLPRRFRAHEGRARTWEYLLNAINAQGCGLFVAETEGTLAGFVQVVVRDAPDIPILVPRRYALVQNLAVREDQRRKGIGQALMDRVHAWARNEGATTVELTVYAFNRAARAFYKRLGYEMLSHRMSRPLGPRESDIEDG